MKREQLEHLLRASGEIIGESHFFVIGSQSILGKYPDAPDALLQSMEADFIPKNKKKELEKLNEIGDESRFKELYGMYVDPVDESTAILPRGWRGRLVNICTAATNGVTGLCLDPHDLFVSKAAAGREKDLDFLQIMVEHRMVDKNRLLELAKTVINPEDDLQRSQRIAGRVERLYTGIEPPSTQQVNEASGCYTGKVLAVSPSLVQQEIGRGDSVFHNTTKIAPMPKVNRTYTIQYTAGKAVATELGLDHDVTHAKVGR